MNVLYSNDGLTFNASDEQPADAKYVMIGGGGDMHPMVVYIGPKAPPKPGLAKSSPINTVGELIDYLTANFDREKSIGIKAACCNHAHEDIRVYASPEEKFEIHHHDADVILEVS